MRVLISWSAPLSIMKMYSSHTEKRKKRGGGDVFMTDERISTKC